MTIATPKELKKHNENVTLHIDMMCINEIGFMTSMSHPCVITDVNTSETMQMNHFAMHLTKCQKFTTKVDTESKQFCVIKNAKVSWKMSQMTQKLM